MMKLSYMIVLSLFVEFDKIDATKSSFYRFLSKLTKTLLYGSTWQKVGAVFVTFVVFCQFLSRTVHHPQCSAVAIWNKLFYKQWLTGSMLIIPTALAMQITDIHYGNPSWDVKSGAPQGRNVHDISYCEDPEHILNGSRPAGRSWLQAG